MSSMIQSAMAHLNSVMAEVESETATYRRGGLVATIQVTVAAAKVSPMTVLAGVMADRDFAQPSPLHADHPFFFNASELDFGDGIIEEPTEGDTLELSSGNVYVLARPLTGESEWAYVGGHERGTAARIRWNGRLDSRT